MFMLRSIKEFFEISFPTRKCKNRNENFTIFARYIYNKFYKKKKTNKLVAKIQNININSTREVYLSRYIL